MRIEGVVWYRVNETQLIPRENILHIMGLPDASGLQGLSVIQYARESIGLGLATQEHGARFFSNGAKPLIVLEVATPLKKEQIAGILDAWNKHHQGLDKTHKTAVLHSGAKANAISINHEDAQFLQTRQFSVREIAAWFGVPPHKLGDTTRTAYASLEQENQSYLDEALDPWLCTWESECWDKLLTEAEKDADTHVIEFTRNALVRADMAARFAAYNVGIQGGWLSRDEVRARENMNPIPDGNGEDFLMPLNMTPAARSTSLEAHKTLLSDVVTRMGKRLSKAAESVKVEKRADWLATGLEADHRAVIVAAFAPVVAACNAVSKTQLNADALAGELIAETRKASDAHQVSIDIEGITRAIVERLN